MPIALVLTIVAVNGVLAHKAPVTAQPTRPASTSKGTCHAIWNSEIVASTLQSAAGPCLFVLFYALPLVSSIAFRAFSCECFDYSRLCYLRADYELICGEKVRKKARPLSSVAILLIVTCV